MGPRLLKLHRQTSGNETVFSLVFSEPVFGVDAQDFLLIQSPTSQASIASVVSSGASSVNVNVEHNAGNGTFHLQLNGRSIFDQSAEPMPGGRFGLKSRAELASGFDQHRVVAADLWDADSDGKLDLITTYSDNSQFVSRGNGDGTFQARSPATTLYATPKSNTQTVDLNGDGIVDRLTHYQYAYSILSADITSTALRVEIARDDGGYWIADDLRNVGQGSPIDLEVGDVNNDGLIDIVAVHHYGRIGASISSYSVHLQQPPLIDLSSFTGAVSNPLRGFGSEQSAGGWVSQDRHPRTVADVNGDGRADIVGFGDDGMYVSLGQYPGQFYFGEPFPFSPIKRAVSLFGASEQSGSWTSYDRYPRQLADVNADGRDDAIGFGDDTVTLALANSDGSFGSVLTGINSFGASPNGGGWISNDRFPRQLGDVDGDGRADIVGFGASGVYVALAVGAGAFSSPVFAASSFGFLPEAGGWTSDKLFHRELADINGDGRDDIVGFGDSGVYVALANGDGRFGTAFLASNSFGRSAEAGGWQDYNLYPRMLADINGDDREDIIAFGDGGVYVAMAQTDGHFNAAVFSVGNFGAALGAGGWTSFNQYPRALGDMNADGRVDLFGFGGGGVYVSLGVQLDLG